MPTPVPEAFLVDSKGKRVGVVLSVRTYRRILRQLEELDDIRAYDSAKTSSQASILFEETLKRIERRRR